MVKGSLGVFVERLGLCPNQADEIHTLVRETVDESGHAAITVEFDVGKPVDQTLFAQKPQSVPDTPLVVLVRRPVSEKLCYVVGAKAEVFG